MRERKKKKKKERERDFRERNFREERKREKKRDQNKQKQKREKKKKKKKKKKRKNMMKTSPNPYYLCFGGFSFICCFLLCPFLLEVVTVSFLSGSLFFSPDPPFGVPRKANSLIFPWKKTIWGQLICFFACYCCC